MRWIVSTRAMAGAAAVAALLSVGVARAQNLIDPGTVSFDAETLFMQLYMSGGTRNSNATGFDASERLALTYHTDNNVGFRTTWFAYDQIGQDSAVGQYALDAFNVDFEVLKRLEFANRTILEVSGGVRYLEAEHFLDGPTNFSDFEGFGGLFGVRGGVRVCDDGLLYARGKFAVLAGEGSHDGNSDVLNPGHEMIRSQTEIGFGYEHRCQLWGVTMVPRIGAEWQMWDGFGIDPVDEHPDTDLGLFGLVAGLGVAY